MSADIIPFPVVDSLPRRNGPPCPVLALPLTSPWRAGLAAMQANPMLRFQPKVVMTAERKRESWFALKRHIEAMERCGGYLRLPSDEAFRLDLAGGLTDCWPLH